MKKKKQTKSTIFLMCFLSSLVLLSACKDTPKNDADKLQVTVTIEPLRYVTEKLGGNNIDVRTFVPKGLSPETYEPTPQQLIALKESKLYLAVGELGFERIWLDRLKENASETQFVRTDNGIRLIESNHNHTHDTTSSCNHAGTDPHIWTTPQNMIQIAKNIYQALNEIRPELKDTFSIRMKSFEKEMLQIDSLLQSTFSKQTIQRSFLIYHPTLSYFAQTYGLKQIAIEENGKSPSPAQLQQIIETCRQNKVQVIFIQQEFDQRNAEIISRETGTKIVRINPLAYDWKEEIMHIAHTLSDKI